MTEDELIFEQVEAEMAMRDNFIEQQEKWHEGTLAPGDIDEAISEFGDHPDIIKAFQNGDIESLGVLFERAIRDYIHDVALTDYEMKMK